VYQIGLFIGNFMDIPDRLCFGLTKYSEHIFVTKRRKAIPMSESKWDQSKEYYIAYSILINAAQHQGFTTYQEIAQAISLPTAGSYMGSQVGDLLGTISDNEKKQDRPMLSAIAIGTSGKPGPGFIPWAKKLGFFHEGDDEQVFWENECLKVYKEWKITYRISHTKSTGRNS
jgi:hypothetical protein